MYKKIDWSAKIIQEIWEKFNEVTKFLPLDFETKRNVWKVKCNFLQEIQTAYLIVKEIKNCALEKKKIIDFIGCLNLNNK